MRARLLILAAAAATMLLAELAAPAGADKPATPGTPGTGPALRSYETRYYIIYSDEDRPLLREAAARLTAMAEEYHERTKGFAGKIRNKLPCYIYHSRDDYYAAGGIKGSSGMFNGKALLMIGGGSADGRLWHTLQHEGFHQFAHSVIRGDLPVWVNEGLAEYFGEAIFAGDTFVAGIVAPGRLARVKGHIEKNDFRPLREMMTFTSKEWSGDINMTNYDQAWSMVHFLVHADNGKYAGGLSSYLSDVGNGVKPDVAWARPFGKDIDAFEKHWKEYWPQVQADASAELYNQATASIVTSFYARAWAKKQPFLDMADFFAAAGDDKLLCAEDDWLPPSLMQSALPKARKMGQWTVATQPARMPQLTCKTPAGVEWQCAFALVSNRVEKTSVTSRPAASQPAKWGADRGAHPARPSPTSVPRPAP